MGRRISDRHIRLDEGTTYAVEVRDDEQNSLEWICRYGLPAEVYAVRLEIASLLASYESLFHASNVTRNRRINEMKEALRNPWVRRPMPQPSDLPKEKK